MEDLALCRFQSVNNDVIDSHHEKIIGFFNVLLTATDQLDDETYEEIVHELINYAGYHFETEENYMIEMKYDDIDDHIKEHRAFAEKLEQLNTLTTNDEHKYKELIYSLGNWVLKHETEKDIQLVNAMNSKSQ